MLTCKTIHNKLINPLQFLDEPRLRLLSRANRLICPACKEPLIYRRGTKIPHFAHHAHCLIPYWEPESEAHLAGKAMVWEICQRMGLRSQLERFIPETKQLADIFIEPNIAIEVQMSKISSTEYERRRSLYKEANIKDFWFWGRDIPSPSLPSSLNNRKLVSIQGSSFSFAIYTDRVEIIPEVGQRYFRVVISGVYNGFGGGGAGGIGTYDILASKAIFWKGLPDTKDHHNIQNDILRWVHCIRTLDDFSTNCRKKYGYYKWQWGLHIIRNFGFTTSGRYSNLLTMLNSVL